MSDTSPNTDDDYGINNMVCISPQRRAYLEACEREARLARGFRGFIQGDAHTIIPWYAMEQWKLIEAARLATDKAREEAGK